MKNSYESCKIALVKGLLLECPLDKPLDKCPAKTIRGLPREEQLQLVDGMKGSELDLIICHHRQCFQERRLEYLGNDL